MPSRGASRPGFEQQLLLGSSDSWASYSILTPFVGAQQDDPAEFERELSIVSGSWSSGMNERFTPLPFEAG
jgi:hypothetical protein